MKNIQIFVFAILFAQLLTAQTAFKHTATSANISGNWTMLDNAETNNNPNVLLQVTSDYGSAGPYHNKAIGVWYSNGKWTIFNQDRTPMTVNAKFNVMVVPPSENAFIHTSTERSGHVTVINNPKLNNKPNAKFIVTQNWGNAGPYNANSFGVYYTGSNWAIYNQNFAAMPLGAKFNIVINDAIFVVDASAPQGNYFFFDNPSTTSKRNALVFATQYWTNVYNANEIGVWYSGNKWSVYNQSQRALPRNAKFMVWGYESSPLIFNPGPITAVALCVTVYEQPNYQGRSVTFCEAGSFTAPFPIRSVRVPRGYIINVKAYIANEFAGDWDRDLNNTEIEQNDPLSIRKLTTLSLSTWQNALNGIFSGSCLRLNNYTPVQNQYDRNEREFYRPNDSYIRLNFNGNIIPYPIPIDVIQTGPNSMYKMYINDWNTNQITATPDNGRIKISLLFEDNGVEVVGRCYRNTLCDFSPAPNFNYSNSRIDIYLTLVASGGKVSYTAANVFTANVAESGPCVNNFFGAFCPSDRAGLIKGTIEAKLNEHLNSASVKFLLGEVLSRLLPSGTTVSQVSMASNGNIQIW
jgi:hypothetical protein